MQIVRNVRNQVWVQQSFRVKHCSFTFTVNHVNQDVTSSGPKSGRVLNHKINQHVRLDCSVDTIWQHELPTR